MTSQLENQVSPIKDHSLMLDKGDKDKDIYYKFEVLKTALIKEKEKNKSISNELCLLKEEKSKWKSNSIENDGQYENVRLRIESVNERKQTNVSSSYCNDDEKISLLSEYEIQNESLKQMLDQANLSIKTIKASFQEIIKNIESKSKGYETNLIEKSNEYMNLMKNYQIVQSLNKTQEMKIQNLENKIKNLEDEKEEKTEKINELLIKLQSEDQNKTCFEESIISYSSIISGLKDQINKMKEMLLDENFSDKVFNSYKKNLFEKKKGKLIFTSHEGKLCLCLYYEESEVRKYIPLDNFEYSRVISNTSNEHLIEIKYCKEKDDQKPIIKSYFIEEDTDEFINTYKDYSAKASRLKLNKEIFKNICF